LSTTDTKLKIQRAPYITKHYFVACQLGSQLNRF